MTTRQRPALLVAVLAATALLTAACGSPSTTPVANTGTAGGGTGAVLSTRSSTTLGTVVVDAQGKTVYLFAIDSPGHSACTGACLQYWPLVAAPATLPTSLPGITGTLGVLDRPDGAKQLTLGGWPLYTYAGDSAPGSTAGEGLNLSGGLWWAVSPSGSAVKGPGSSPSSSSGGYSRGY
jgi:predicted lipoprotein with Yx(FWY)xxD motif